MDVASPDVTTTLRALLPGFSTMGADALPLATGVPLTVMVWSLIHSVGVSVALPVPCTVAV